MPKPKHIVAILFKNNMTAVLAVDTEVPFIGHEPHVRHVLGQTDIRNDPQITRSLHDAPNCAINYFYSSLASSRENGWTVAHLGTRNWG